MRFTRREVLIAGLAFGCTPARSYAPGFSNEVPSNPDVIVVGAGAAGLGATRTLTHKGKTVVLLEATVRTGGRAFTDYDTFGVPYDVGAHWLHYGKANPFKRYGEHLGDEFSIYPAPNKSIVYKGEEQLCAGNCEAYNAAYEEAVGEIWEARSLDEAASKVVDTQGEWGKTVAFTIGPWETAKHLKDISTRDWSCTIDSDEEICEEGCGDYLCAQGYGALLAHSARGVPVQLQTTVSEIRQTKYGVEVVTNRGTLTARACIVTVSNGVLANGNIAFSPRLPDAKYAAFENVSMGLYNHIGLKFRTNIFGSHSDWFALSQLDSSRTGPPNSVAFVTDVSGTGIVYCDVGGGFAHELEKEGRQASIDYALSQLKAMLGPDTVNKNYEGLAHASAWGSNPHTLGSFASAQPGASKLRDELRVPVNDRVFFAGEACDVGQWGTVGGAHLSGCETAHNVALMLDGEPQLGFGSCSEIFNEEGATSTPTGDDPASNGPDCHDMLGREKRAARDHGPRAA